MEPLLFAELPISDALKQGIAQMGFIKTTPIQQESLFPILEGHDLVAQAPTGTGKTCAFGVPIL